MKGVVAVADPSEIEAARARIAASVAKDIEAARKAVDTQRGVLAQTSLAEAYVLKEAGKLTADAAREVSLVISGASDALVGSLRKASESADHAARKIERYTAALAWATGALVAATLLLAAIEWIGRAQEPSVIVISSPTPFQK
jgi:hypothetical protein